VRDYLNGAPSGRFRSALVTGTTIIVLPGTGREAGARVGGIDTIGIRARHDSRRSSHCNGARRDLTHHHRARSDRRPLTNRCHDNRSGAKPAIGADCDSRQRSVFEVNHSGIVAGVLVRPAQYLYGSRNVGAVANVDHAKHTVGADVDVSAHSDLRMSEIGAELDTPVERASCERQPVECHPKVIADDSGYKREGLREEFEPELRPPEAREQCGRQREAEEDSLHAAFGNRFHGKGPACRASGQSCSSK